MCFLTQKALSLKSDSILLYKFLKSIDSDICVVNVETIKEYPVLFSRTSNKK